MASPCNSWITKASRSLAIAPDGQRFLLGTEFSIHLFDHSGQKLWNVPGPAVAWP